MDDPLVQVATRVYAEFADRATVAEVLAVVAGCRDDLDTPNAAALPELVERLARQRLTDRLASPGPLNGAPADEHRAANQPGRWPRRDAPLLRDESGNGAGLDDRA